jgi:hypothetical protein
MSKLPLLTYCRVLFAADPRSPAPLKCIWRGTSGTIKMSRLRKLTRTQPLDCAIAERKHERGPYPVLYAEQHLAHFCSYVPLYNETSSARIAALYLLCRLFPNDWRAHYQAAFGGELPDSGALLSVDQYTFSMGAPDWYEMCEMAALFVDHMKPETREEREAAEAQFVAVKTNILAAFGVERGRWKRSLLYQLEAYATVLRAALADEDVNALVTGVRQMGVCTDRQLDKLERRWLAAKANESAVAAILRQFKMCN